MNSKWIGTLALAGLCFSFPGPEIRAEEKTKFGGRIQNDWSVMSGDPGYEPLLADGTEFRRARLFVSGDLNESVKFKAQFDFADKIDRTFTDSAGDTVTIKDSPAFKDLYLELHDVPGVGGIRFGHYKEPFSLEELTSSKYITFLERALPNVFAPSRNTGVMLYNDHADGRLTWAFGAFTETGNDGASVGGSANYTGRVTGLPWYKDEANFLHLGLSLSSRTPDDGTVRFRARPEAHLADRPISTGKITNVEDYITWSAEGALNLDWFSVQGEYIAAELDDGATDPSFDGYYLQVSFWPSKDHRRYKKSAASFDRVKPRSPFDPKKGGAGAWELAARYSQLDLTETPNPQAPPTGSTAQIGGEISDLTLGINWHLNDNTRFMLNYINSELKDGSMGVKNDADIFLARVQVEF